jgi:membrane protein
MKKWLVIVQDTWRNFNENQMSRMGAALAYYAFFSFFPLMFLLIALVGYALALGWPQALDAQDFVLDSVQQAVPVLGEVIRERIAAVVEARGTLGLVGIATLLWSASNIFDQLSTAFGVIFDGRPLKESFWGGLRRRLLGRVLALAMVLAVGLLLPLLLVLSALRTAAAAYSVRLLPESHRLWELVPLAALLVVEALLFATLFRFLPRRRIAWRSALVGGTLTALAWEAGKQGLAWYLVWFPFDEAYGVIGSVMALLIWTYYVSQILFLGAEFAAVHDLHWQVPRTSAAE